MKQGVLAEDEDEEEEEEGEGEQDELKSVHALLGEEGGIQSPRLGPLPSTNIKPTRKKPKPTAALTESADRKRIRIRLKSYWLDLLQASVDRILEAAKTTGATVSGPVFLPRRWGCGGGGLGCVPCRRGRSVSGALPQPRSAPLPPPPHPACTPACRIRKWTVLRSPHVNKDSREQFEQRTYSRLIDIKNPSQETVDKLMQLDIPAGVHIDVKA